MKRDQYSALAGSAPAGSAVSGARSAAVIGALSMKYSAMAPIKDYVAFYPDRVDEIAQ